MRALVISDVHGERNTLETLLKNEKCDAVFFCGDGLSDVLRAEARFPQIRFYCTAGNCDMLCDAREISVEIEGVKIFAVHGHRHMARNGEHNMISAAKAVGAQILLYGHTHIAVHHFESGIEVVNPGSLGYGASYALLDIDGGTVNCRLKTIGELIKETHP